MDRTGRALGTLDPAIYLENASGYIMLLPVEKGKGTNTARKLYEERYRHQGFEWREAATWSELKRLQKRLVEQSERELQKQGERVVVARAKARAQTLSNIRQRMASADCDPWERDFLDAWLRCEESKQAQFEQRFMERNQYLFAVEMDSRTPVTDRIKGL